MSVTHVQLFSIPVADQDRAKAFYLGVLGFDLVEDNRMGPNFRWVRVRPKGADTAITLVTWFETMPAGSLRGVVLESDDVDADATRLASLGVEIPEGIQDAPWGRYIQFADPDGNGLIVQASTGVSRWED